MCNKLIEKTSRKKGILVLSKLVLNITMPENQSKTT